MIPSSFQPKQATGTLSLISACFLYGFVGVLTKIVGYNLPFFYQSGVRTLFVALVIFIPLLLQRSFKRVTSKDFLWISFRAISGLICFVLFFNALVHLPVGASFFNLYAGSTIGGYIMGWIFFNERFTQLSILVLILSMIGLGLIYLSAITLSEPIWIGFACISGLSLSFWNTVSKKVSDRYSATQLNFLDNALMVPFIFLFSLISREQMSLPTFTLPWISTFLLGCIFIINGFLMVIGFKYLRAQTGSIIMLSEIIFNIVIAMLFIAEQPTSGALLGGGLIIVAIILSESIALIKRKHTAKV